MVDFLLAYLIEGRVIIRLLFIIWELNMQGSCIFSIRVRLHSAHGI